MEYLYVLELEDGKYYVGKTSHTTNRYEQHKRGNGCEWTSIYRPIRIVEQRELKDEFDETNTTKQYMKRYGIENVRGGAYCQVELPYGAEELIRHELRDSEDKCYKCGKPGHFAKNCKRKSSFTATCECGTKFLDFDEYTTHMKGCRIRNKPSKQIGKCYRCGRAGHYSPDCYAKTNVRGEYLDSDDD